MPGTALMFGMSWGTKDEKIFVIDEKQRSPCLGGAGLLGGAGAEGKP